MAPPAVRCWVIVGGTALGHARRLGAVSRAAGCDECSPPVRPDGCCSSRSAAAFEWRAAASISVRACLLGIDRWRLAAVLGIYLIHLFCILDLFLLFFPADGWPARREVFAAFLMAACSTAAMQRFAYLRRPA